MSTFAAPLLPAVRNSAAQRAAGAQRAGNLRGKAVEARAGTTHDMPADTGADFHHRFSAIDCDEPLRVHDRQAPMERDADRVADALTGRRPVEHLEMTTALDRGEMAGTVQPHAPDGATRIIPDTTAARLRGGRPPGAAIDEGSRSEFEPRLGRGLGEVRVHTDANAARDARALDARAFTHGQEIFFNAGEYQPHTPSGRWLLAHEVAHTQQATPAVVSRFVAGASIPEAPTATGTHDDAGSEIPGAIADEIENTLETDPEDKSGQAARRLAKLPPARRRNAAVLVRSKPGRAGTENGDGVIPKPVPPPPPDGSTAASVPAKTSRGEHPPVSREEQARRSEVSAESPHPPRSSPGGSRPAATPAGISPRVPPSLTRTSAEPPAPALLPGSPPREPPEAAATAQDEMKGAAAAGAAGERESNGGAEAPDKRGGSRGPSGEDEGPLQLSDLLELADPEPGFDVAPSTTPPASPSPVGPAAASRRPALSPPAPSFAVAEASSGDLLPTQRLALPLSPVEANVEEEEQFAEELRDPAEIAAEMEGHAVELESALAGGREALQAHADAVRHAVRRDAAAARGGIRASVDRTAAAIQSGGESLLGQLASSVRAAHAAVNVKLTIRGAEASLKGLTSQATILGIFVGHRKTVERTVNTAVENAEKLRTRKVKSAQDRNRRDIRTAYARGAARMNSYPGTNRGAFIGGATFDIAEGTANEMRAQEPDVVAAVNEVTAPLPQHFRYQGAQALDGFDQNLPEIIASVSTGIGETRGELGRRADEAHLHLDEFAAGTALEITNLMMDAIAQARDFLPPAEQQLDRALGDVLRSIAAAPDEVIERVAPPVEEAITLLRMADDPDVESAPQLKEALLRFIAESVAMTSATLEQAGSAAKERFQAMSGGARQAMRGLQGRTDDTWKGSRTGISTTLERTVESADTGMGGVVRTFGDALGETEQSIRDELSPTVSDLKGSFETALRDAEVDIDSRINDGLGKNSEALGGLDAKMQEAAEEAAWEWDHPVLSTLSFIAGILVGIIKVLALVALLIVLVIVLAKVLAVSALVAGLILLAGMVSFSIGYAFGARLAAGQGVGEAFGGAVIDFGRAAPGMLYEMTGIPKLKRAFSDERMTPYERGKLVGEGGTELVLAIFAVRGAATGVAKGFRKLPRIPWRRPVRVPAGSRSPAAAPTAEPRIGFGRRPGPRAPGAERAPEPRIGFGREPGPRAPRAEPGSEPTIGFGREPGPRTTAGEPVSEPRIGIGREPAGRAPGAARPSEPRIGFGREQGPRPSGADPAPEPRVGFGRETAPRPRGSERAPGRTGKTPGPAEAPEPISLGSEPRPRVGGTAAEGPAPRLGGRSTVEPRASAQTGSGARPSRPATGAQSTSRSTTPARERAATEPVPETGAPRQQRGSQPGEAPAEGAAAGETVRPAGGSASRSPGSRSRRSQQSGERQPGSGRRRAESAADEGARPGERPKPGRTPEEGAGSQRTGEQPGESAGGPPAGERPPGGAGRGPEPLPGATGTRHLPREFSPPRSNRSDFPSSSAQIGTPPQRAAGIVRPRGAKLRPGDVRARGARVPKGRSGARDHWREHGHEFPEHRNAREYLQGAIDFCRSPTTYRFYYRHGGRPTIGYYNPQTNTFAATSVDGQTIFTYFRPGNVTEYVRAIRLRGVGPGQTPRHAVPLRQ